MRYKVIHDPQEGDEVVYVGVYALRWRQEWGVEPTIAVTRIDEPSYDELVEINKRLLEAVETWIGYHYAVGKNAGATIFDVRKVMKKATIAKAEGKDE